MWEIFKLREVWENVNLAIQKKIFNWKRSLIFAFNWVYATKLVWLGIGAPTLILNSIHLHHLYYGLALLGYNIFRKFKQRKSLSKPTFAVGLVLFLDGLKDTLLFPGTAVLFY